MQTSTKYLTAVAIVALGLVGLYFTRRPTDQSHQQISSPLVSLPANPPKNDESVFGKNRLTAAAISVAKLPGPAPAQAEPPVSGHTAKLAGEWLAAAEKSDFVKMRIAETTGMTRDSFSAFFAQLGLSSEQINHLAVLLSERRLAATNAALAELRRGMLPDPDSDVFLADLLAERGKADVAIRAFLGDDRFRELQNYAATREVENVFTRVGRVVGNTPDALSEVQNAQLRDLLQQQPDGRLSRDVIASAAQFLSVPQVQALESAYQSQVEIFRQRNHAALPPRPNPSSE